MNLLEHHAKALLREAEVPVPTSWLVTSADQVPKGVVYPVVAKSQVPVGGRGKAGGIVVVEDETGLSRSLNTLFNLDIKGHMSSAVLLEAKIEIKRELYLALRLNRDSRRVEWLVSSQGGIDIEANANTVVTVDLDHREWVTKHLGIDYGDYASLLDSLEKVFRNNDMLLLEINPLVEQHDGSLICADAKIIIDDNARIRHPELPWPEVAGNPPKPLGGTIGCIANGAGMAMSTMDTIVAAGGRPANFLDIGGGTGEKEFVTALRQIMELPGVTSIIVNIFAGISRCDEIARGIIAAREQLPDLQPLFIRLEGTNRDIAVELLTAADITIEPDLKTCVQKAMQAVSEDSAFPAERDKTNNQLASSAPEEKDSTNGDLS